MSRAKNYTINYTKASTSIAQLEYSGRLKVTAMKNNRVLWTYSGHNAGTFDLFYFLCLSLIGNFTEAKKFVPSVIKLRDNTNSYQERESGSNPIIDVSQKVGFYGAPTAKYTPGSTPEVTFHFFVPYTAIIMSNTASDITYNQITLFSGDNRALANYYIVGEREGQIDWSDRTVSYAELTSGFNLLIDWTLSFENTKDAVSNA